MSSNSPAGRVVRVRRCGQAVLVEPAVPPLGRFLTAYHLAVVADGGGYALERRRPPLYRVEDEWGNGECVGVCRAGLEPLLVEGLCRGGYAVQLTGERPDPLPEPDVSRLRALEALDRPLLDLVQRHDRGVVRYDPGRVNPGHMIGQVAAAWPTKRVLVIASRRVQVKQLARQISEVTRERVGVLMGGRILTTAPRVLVSTPRANGCVDWDRLDVIFVLGDGATFPDRETYRRLRDPAQARLDALIPRGTRLAPHERDVLTATFGPRALTVPAHGFAERPVGVAWHPVRGGPRLPRDAEPWELQRAGVWEHSVRNRRVARVAAALSRGDAAAAGFPAGGGASGLGQAPRVLVLVESVEHALALAALLRDWPVVTDEDVCTRGLQRRERGLLLRHRDTDPSGLDRAIATAAGARRIDLSAVDAVVRADGGAGALPPECLRALEVPWRESRPLFVVDFADRHHRQLRNRSDSRRLDYLERGWFEAGRTIGQTQFDHFLATRPEQ